MICFSYLQSIFFFTFDCFYAAELFKILAFRESVWNCCRAFRCHLCWIHHRVCLGRMDQSICMAKIIAGFADQSIACIIGLSTDPHFQKTPLGGHELISVVGLFLSNCRLGPLPLVGLSDHHLSLIYHGSFLLFGKQARIGRAVQFIRQGLQSVPNRRTSFFLQCFFSKMQSPSHEFIQEFFQRMT